MKPQISKIKHELNRLQDFMNLCCDPRVRKVLNTIRDERAPRVAELQNQLAEARRNAPAKKPRWPDNVPDNVLDACNRYWQGTEESRIFRIHCWNDKLVCTSYPAGGYSTNGGWVKTRATFYFLSLTQASGKPLHAGLYLQGRRSKKQLEATLAERSKTQ